ncbi:MAG: hypothetical protein AB7O26_07520 [Planctomycetaceae bacterium]
MANRVLILADQQRQNAIVFGEQFQPSRQQVEQLVRDGKLNGITDVAASIANFPLDTNDPLFRPTVMMAAMVYSDKVDFNRAEWTIDSI